MAYPRGGSKDDYELILREARLHSLLEHPNIVRLYDIGLEEGKPFFTMKFVEGFTLEKYILKKAEGKDLNTVQINELLDIFLKICDAISLHVHVNEETKHMINKDILDIGIKYLINTSRGEIVNESDVIAALKSGKLKGYGTDVIEEEFGFLEKSPFFKDENKGLNFILTPHVGGMTIEGQQKAYKWSIEKI